MTKTETLAASSPAPEAGIGVFYAVLAFVTWGFMPWYIGLFAGVAPLEILAYRSLWALPCAALLLCFQKGGWRQVGKGLANPRTLLTLLVTTALVTTNWLVFIWAIGQGRVLEGSLGYYINPLVNVLLGVVLLRERLSRAQLTAVALAAAAVLYMSLGLGTFPWISLTLALTFGFYGFVRKVMPIDALAGLFIETLFLAPFALFYLGYFDAGYDGFADLPSLIKTMGLGAMTAMPLIWFSAGARRLRYSTVGLLQYIAPSMHFLYAVFLLGEAFTIGHAITFGLIWTALAIYSFDTLRTSRQ